MDKKLTLMLVEDDLSACQQMMTALSGSAEDFAIVGVTNNCARALQCVREFRPDAIILDVKTQNKCSDGLTFMEKLRDEDIPSPYILVLAASDDVSAHELAREYGADFIMPSDGADFNAKSVVDFLKIARTVISARKSADTINTVLPDGNLEEKKTHRRICNELDKVGISSKCIGYRYLTEAIEIIMKQPVQHVCRIIGENKGKTANSVERAMQNAINRAWAGTDPEELAANYTAKIKSSKGIPTITEFIYHYAHKLNNEF